MSGENHYDVARIKQQIDLIELARGYATLQPWAQNEWAGPCPHTGCVADENGFHVHADGWFKCYQCHPKRGDLIEFVQWLGLESNFRSACAWLETYHGGGTLACKPHDRQRMAAPKQEKRDWSDPQWQEEARASVQAATQELDSPAGEAGRSYLAERGILPTTYRAWGLGFDPAKYDPSQKRKRPTVVLPWYWGDQLSAVKYRFIDSTATSDRFTQKGGGEQKLFGLQMRGMRYHTLIICEGELNAVSIWQALGQTIRSSVDVLSFGSDGATTSHSVGELAEGYRRVIIWADEENRVQEAMKTMSRAFGLRSPRDPARQTPDGKPLKLDANELLKTGWLGEFLAHALASFPLPPAPDGNPDQPPLIESQAAPSGTALSDGDDPRPDLLGDRARWGYLLDRASEIDGQKDREGLRDIDGGLLPALFHLRQLGARIVTVGDDWDLKPDGKLPNWRLASGEIAPERWAQIRAGWLVPHADALGRLLAAPQVGQHRG